MIRQILLGMGFAAHTDLHPGKGLGADFLDDGLDAVMPPGGAVRPDTKSARCQGNIVKQHDDPGRGDVEIAAQLQNGPA